MYSAPTASAPGTGQRADRTVGYGRFDLLPDAFDHDVKSGPAIQQMHVPVHVASGFSGDAGRRRLRLLIQSLLPRPSDTIEL